MRRSPPRPPGRWSALPEEHQRLLRFLEKVRSDNGGRSLRAIGAAMNGSHTWIGALLDGAIVQGDESKVEALVRRGLGGSTEDVSAAKRLLRAAQTVPIDIGPQWHWAGSGGKGYFERVGRGQRNAGRGGDLFRGRKEAVQEAESWLTRASPPGQVLVLVGQPGAGKSAVAARVSLSMAARGISGLAIHARGATHRSILAWLAMPFGGKDIDDRDALLELYRRSTPVGPVSVVVDALDEAIGRSDRADIAQTLVDLSALPSVRILVATRPISAAGMYGPRSVLFGLGAHHPMSPNLINLDTEKYFDLKDIQEYASALLSQQGVDHPGPPGRAWSRYRQDEVLRLRLAETIATMSDRCFLVAAMAAEALSVLEAVVDPAHARFDVSAIPSTIGDALTKFMDSQTDEKRIETNGLLTSLAYARGDGLSDELWVRFARSVGYEVTKSAIDQLRDSRAADYLLETFSEDQGLPVTRLFHQALIDEQVDSRGDRRAIDEWSITQSLLPNTDVEWLDAHQYTKTHIAEHAAAAGRLAMLIPKTRYLSVADLRRLVSHWPANDDLRAHRAVVTLAAGVAPRPTAARQGSILELAALHLGLPESNWSGA